MTSRPLSGFGALALTAGLLLSSAALADPDRNESGNGRRGREGRGGGPAIVMPVPVPRGYDAPRAHRYAREQDRHAYHRRGGYGDGYGYDRRGRYAERMPNGHLPPQGECRTWIPGRPAGHQPPPGRC
jgi:hypothetical protein